MRTDTRKGTKGGGKLSDVDDRVLHDIMSRLDISDLSRLKISSKAFHDLAYDIQLNKIFDMTQSSGSLQQILLRRPDTYESIGLTFQDEFTIFDEYHPPVFRVAMPQSHSKYFGEKGRLEYVNLISPVLDFFRKHKTTDKELKYPIGTANHAWAHLFTSEETYKRDLSFLLYYFHKIGFTTIEEFTLRNVSPSVNIILNKVKVQAYDQFVKAGDKISKKSTVM